MSVCEGVDFPVYALQDDSAIVINDNTQKFIGSNPVKIGNGQLVS
jgi:hypothetical protein